MLYSYIVLCSPIVFRCISVVLCCKRVTEQCCRRNGKSVSARTDCAIIGSLYYLTSAGKAVFVSQFGLLTTLAISTGRQPGSPTAEHKRTTSYFTDRVEVGGTGSFPWHLHKDSVDMWNIIRMGAAGEYPVNIPPPLSALRSPALLFPCLR